jgi:hypothetical protein
MSLPKRLVFTAALFCDPFDFALRVLGRTTTGVLARV